MRITAQRNGVFGCCINLIGCLAVSICIIIVKLCKVAEREFDCYMLSLARLKCLSLCVIYKVNICLFNLSIDVRRMCIYLDDLFSGIVSGICYINLNNYVSILILWNRHRIIGICKCRIAHSITKRINDTCISIIIRIGHTSISRCTSLCFRIKEALRCCCLIPAITHVNAFLIFQHRIQVVGTGTFVWIICSIASLFIHCS